ncbi:MAG: OadG family protein [Clostridiales Family XIII bacterium]|jgi:Na+-transporting methylmalonyl-CoA/oxaloacetate decarboxylase gamma subunit|nr:OadG family protein [Clostridiales Family XIII bacterium]
MGFIARLIGKEQMADDLDIKVKAPQKPESTDSEMLIKDARGKAVEDDELIAVIAAAIEQYESAVAYTTPLFRFKKIDRKKGSIPTYGQERIYQNLR